MAEQTNQERITYFCSVTGASEDVAIEHLAAVDWDTNLALSTFFQDEEGAETGTGAGAATNTVPDTYTGPRTLDGRPAAASGSSAATAKKPQKKKGLMTMSSLVSGSSSRGHDHDDDEDKDEDEDEGHGRGDLFAGGEKSGLAVKDPNMGGPSSDAQRLIREIIAKAKKNTPNEEAGGSSSDADHPRAPPRSWGAGQTLGGDNVPSRRVQDPSRRPLPGDDEERTSPAAAAAGAGMAAETQERVLHIWQDGFSIDDGPLHRFDDPRNAADLAMIRQGRAPLHLMNVRFGQSVDVKLHQHEEDWYQLPRVYRPFSGAGRRLGSPVPGESSTTTTTTTATTAAVAAAAAATTTSATSASPAPPAIDETRPTLNIRVSLPDGTRLPARFNTTQTIGDVYDFVRRAMPPSAGGRAWVLTTFPNKEHTDHGVVLSETDEFKRGGAATVKWV